MDNWDEVRTAFQVAHMGTVSGAAEVLGVHHATVIRHIDAIEARIGVKLFQRHARGYTPTEAGADLLRHDVVHDAGDESHRHEEDHDHAVRGKDLVEVVRGEVALRAAGGKRLLCAHHQGVRETADEHDEAKDHVHDPDLLVVDAGQPVTPQRYPETEVGHQGDNRDTAEDDTGEGADQNGFVVGDPVKRETAENRRDRLGRRECGFSCHWQCPRPVRVAAARR